MLSDESTTCLTSLVLQSLERAGPAIFFLVVTRFSDSLDGQQLDVQFSDMMVY